MADQSRADRILSLKGEIRALGKLMLEELQPSEREIEGALDTICGVEELHDEYWFDLEMAQLIEAVRILTRPNIN